MGHIKEPKGIDLVINSRPLTKDEEIGISDYIRAYKAKHRGKQSSIKRASKSIARKKVAA